MNRTTCQRCGNANPWTTHKCLACDAPLPEFKASEQLTPDDFAIFTEQVRNDINRARRRLNAARAAREAVDDQAASWLQSLNSSKAYAYKHGVNIDDL